MSLLYSQVDGARRSPPSPLRSPLPAPAPARVGVRRPLVHVPVACAVGAEVRDRRPRPRRHPAEARSLTRQRSWASPASARSSCSSCAGSSSACRARSSTTSGTISSRRLQQMPLAYYQARRTGDLMSRATNDLNAVRTMIGPAVMYSASTVLVFAVAIVLMCVDRRAADADRAAAAAAGVDQRQVLRQRDPPAVRGDPGAARRPERGRAGNARRRPRRARLQPGAARDRALPRAPIASTCAATGC